MRFTVAARAREVSFSLPRKLYALEAVQGAAHVLSDRATAFVDESRSSWELTLCAKTAADREALQALGREFVDEALNQALRQRLVANSRPIFEHIVSRAVVSARGAEPEPAELSAAEKAELERLMAEAEAELAARRAAGAGAKTAQTWEERHGRPRTG